jgi:hypothetical protein
MSLRLCKKVMLWFRRTATTGDPGIQHIYRNFCIRTVPVGPAVDSPQMPEDGNAGGKYRIRTPRTYSTRTIYYWCQR